MHVSESFLLYNSELMEMFQVVLQCAATPVSLPADRAGQWPEVSVSQGMLFQAG